MCVVIMYFSFKYMWIGKTGLKLLGLFFFHMCNSCFRKKEHMCSPLDSDSKSTLIEGQTPAVRLLQERQYFQTSHSVSSQTPPTEKTLTRDAKTYRILNILEFELTIFWPLTQNLSFSFFPFFYTRGQTMEIMHVLRCPCSAVNYFVMSHSTVVVNGAYESRNSGL